MNPNRVNRSMLGLLRGSTWVSTSGVRLKRQASSRRRTITEESRVSPRCVPRTFKAVAIYEIW